MTIYQPQYPQENLEQHRVYVFISAACGDNEIMREDIAFEVLADHGNTLTGKVTSTPEFSQDHGYCHDKTYEIPKSQINSYTRSLRVIPPLDIPFLRPFQIAPA